MQSYIAPLADQRFLLEHVFDIEAEFGQWTNNGELPDLDLIGQMYAEAGKFAADVVMPLNARADREGCVYKDGVVTTSAGFVEAYRKLCELGWPSLSCDAAWGGQGMPKVVFAGVQEMFSSASQAFQMFASINQCAHDCLSRVASDEIKAAWLPRLVDGSVVATMCMSEPQAGSDLGLLTTRAVAQPEGSYRISGTKIFASGAEHDLTPNIMHLVLARIVGAPPGTRGLSLFVVPKIKADGTRNSAVCLGIEHKMGLHGSPTCVMSFDEAEGAIVSQPERGLPAMFYMMNSARLSTGTQSVGAGEVAWQQATAYARDRRQGRVPGAPKHATRTDAADPIAGHADVIRMLRVQQAYTEGGRALACWTAVLIDRAVRHADPQQRARADEAVALLTPVVKGFLSENALICTSLALQVHGGHGYISETGIDQYWRDARVNTIYEGTTGIQATDLLVRKIIGGDPKTVSDFAGMLADSVVGGADHPDLARRHAAVLQNLIDVTAEIRHRALADPAHAYSVATDYLRLFGHAVMATLWLRMAVASKSLAPTARDDKLATARFYFDRLLPEIETVLRAMEHSGLPTSRQAAHQAVHQAVH